MHRVSVIIPTYNCAKYVPAAVESVLAQTFTDYELIVVDDGSTDNTREVLQPFEGRLTYVYQRNQERAVARNTGIRASTGEYLAFLDADDLWCSNKLEHQVAVLDQHPYVSLVYCQAMYVDASGNPVRFCGKWLDADEESEAFITDRSSELFLGNVVCGGGSAVMVRRNLLDKVGLFDEALSYPEDWDLWIRLSRCGPFAYISEPLVHYRVYGWRRVLEYSTSERLVEQHIRVVEKAVATWNGNKEEREQLRAEALAVIYIRAALASFQLGRGSQGRFYLEQAILAEPEIATRNRLIHLAVDRATEIETDTGSYQEAKDFIRTFFSNLPASAVQYCNAERDTVGWLYVGGALGRYRVGDSAAVRRLLAQGIFSAPVCLKNRGVVSMALEAWLGKSPATMLRRAAKTIGRFAGRSVNAQD